MESQRSIEKKYNKLLNDVKTKDYYTRIDLKNRVNCYSCEECGYITKTIDVDAGVTPFMIICQCGGSATSSFYKDIKPDDIPTIEWYRPTLREVLKMRKNPFLVEHILKGGLNDRKRIS